MAEWVYRQFAVFEMFLCGTALWAALLAPCMRACRAKIVSPATTPTIVLGALHNLVESELTSIPYSCHAVLNICLQEAVETVFDAC